MKCVPEKWIVPNKEIAICQFATNPGVKERHYKYHSQGVKCSTVVCDWHAADKNRIPKEWRENRINFLAILCWLAGLTLVLAILYQIVK